MRVVPEKSDGRSDHGSAKNCEFPDLRHLRQFQISREGSVPTEVSEHRERSRRDHRATDGQTVETVGKIHRIARPNNNDGDESYEWQERQRPQLRMRHQSLNHEVGIKLLEKWNHQLGGIFSAMLQKNQCDRNDHTGHNLITELGARGEAEVAAMNNFKIIVGKTDGAECQRGENGNPDKRVAQIGPEQSGHQNRDGNQQTAHGRRARLFLVSLRTFFADVLPDLKIAQPPNHDGPNDESREKRGEAREGCAKSEITENTEWRKIMKQFQIEQPVEQSASDISCQLSAVSSQILNMFSCLRQEHRRNHSFASTSPALSPASRLAMLSTIRHRPRGLHAPTIPLLLPALTRTRLSFPRREPLLPSVSPSLARRARSRLCFRRCSVRTRDAVARLFRQVLAFHRPQQFDAAPTWPPAYPLRPSAPSDLNCSNRRPP